MKATKKTVMKRRKIMVKSMKTMKKSVMKATKKTVMKKVMKKVKKVSKRLAVKLVFAGKLNRTKGGLKKDGLTKNKRGRVVSKKRLAFGKKSGWMAAVVKARAALKIKGFCCVGGKTAQGKALLAKSRSFYKKK